MNEKGEADLQEVTQAFNAYYRKRIEAGLPPEKRTCIFTKGNYTDRDVERLILSNPFKRFEDMGYMHHTKVMGVLQIDKTIMRNLQKKDIEELKEQCQKALEKYWNR